MPRVAHWAAKCECGQLICASYDPRKHRWAQACDKCAAPLQWLPVYARPPLRGKARDKQRSKVYAAEREAKCCGKTFTPLREPWRDHVEEILAAVDLNGQVRIKDGRGCRVARGSASQITLPRWARTILVTCHEIAHALTPSGEAPHGPAFTAYHYALVKHFCPREESEALHAAFVNRGVKVDWRLAREFGEKLRTSTE